jgi:hypothetical protein
MSADLHKIRFCGWGIRLPRSPPLRIALGAVIAILGLFGFLPILGFWMIPIGLLVLSVDIAIVRRWRRVAELSVGRRLSRSHPRLARRLGYSAHRRIC